MTLGGGERVTCQRRRSLPDAFFGFMGRPSDPQQVHQRLKLRLAQMAKLLQMAFTHRLIELLQQRQARVGNANVHHAAIVGNPLPGNESALLQAIDESVM